MSVLLFFKSKPKPRAGNVVFLPAEPEIAGVNLRTRVPLVTAVTTLVIIIARS